MFIEVGGRREEIANLANLFKNQVYRTVTFGVFVQKLRLPYIRICVWQCLAKKVVTYWTQQIGASLWTLTYIQATKAKDCTNC